MRSQRVGRARQRRRAEGRHAEPRQVPGDRAIACRLVERVEALDAVHVNVDEPGHDVVAREIEVDAVEPAGYAAS